MNLSLALILSWCWVPRSPFSRCCIEWWYWYFADPPRLYVWDREAGTTVFLHLWLERELSAIFLILLLFMFFFSPNFCMQLWIIWSPLDLSPTLCPKETPSLWWGLCLCLIICLDFCISDHKLHSYLEIVVTREKSVLVLMVVSDLLTMILIRNTRQAN